MTRDAQRVLCVTLVAFYGDKPPALAAGIEALQQLVTRLCPTFVPYALPQVHATLVGLEAQRVNGALHNVNFRALRGQHRPMQLAEALSAVRAAPLWPLSCQWGGFEPHAVYPFASRGQHPYVRSFSLQGERVVTMA